MADNVPSAGPMVGGSGYSLGHSFPFNGMSTGKNAARCDPPNFRDEQFTNYNSTQQQSHHHSMMRPRMNVNNNNATNIRSSSYGYPAIDDSDFASNTFNSYSKMSHEEMMKQQQQQRFPRFNNMNPSQFSPATHYVPPLMNAGHGQNPYSQMSPNSNAPMYDPQHQHFQMHMYQQQQQQQQQQLHHHQQHQHHSQQQHSQQHQLKQSTSRSTTPLSQHSDRPPSSSSLSSNKKVSKSKDKKSTKKQASHREPPSMEEVSMDSNASGSNLSRPNTHSRSNTPNLGNMPAPSPAASSGGSRSNTPAVSSAVNDSNYPHATSLSPPTSSAQSSMSFNSVGQRIFSPNNSCSDVSLMPPPMNPGQGRVFSPPGQTNPQNPFYPQSSSYSAVHSNSNKPGSTMPFNPSDQTNGGGMPSSGFPYNHPQMAMRSPNPNLPPGYRMRDPSRNYQDFRPYVRGAGPDWLNGRMDGAQDVMMRHQNMQPPQQQQAGYRPDMNYYNQPRHAMMFNQVADYPPYYRAPYESYASQQQQQPMHMQSKFHPQQMMQQQHFQQQDPQNTFFESAKFEKQEPDSKQQSQIQDQHEKEVHKNNVVQPSAEQIKSETIYKNDSQNVKQDVDATDAKNEAVGENHKNGDDQDNENKVHAMKFKMRKGSDDEADDVNGGEEKEEDDDKTDEGETTDEDNGNSLNTTENYDLSKVDDPETTAIIPSSSTVTTTTTCTTTQQSKSSMYPRLVDQLKATITTLSTTNTLSSPKPSAPFLHTTNTLDSVLTPQPDKIENETKHTKEEQKYQQQQSQHFQLQHQQQQQQMRLPNQMQHFQQQHHLQFPPGSQKRYHDGELVRPPGVPFYNAYPPHLQQQPPHFGMNYPPPPHPPQHMFNPYPQQHPQQQMYNQQQHFYQQKNIDYPPEKKQQFDRKMSSSIDDQSSSQDATDDNSRMMGDSVVTDESSTSDTLLSYPGTSSQPPNNENFIEETSADHPSKKMKMSKYTADFEPSVHMHSMPPRDQSFHMNMQRLSRNEAFVKLMEMGDEPDRRNFLHDLFVFMESKQSPIIAVPTVSKQPIDLFKLYCIVKKFGGMVEVSKNKKWRDVSSALNMGPSSSAGFVVKKNYGKSIFPFECFHDRGNIDPAPILAYLEQPIKKSSKKSNGDKSSVLDHPNLDPRAEFQNSPRLQEAFPPAPRSSNHQSFSSASPHPPILYPPADAFHHNSSNVDLYSRPQPFSDHSSFGARAMKHHHPAPPSYEHLQMVCQPPSPQKVDRRVLGSHIQKELMFPSNCIESVRPKCNRRKRYNQKQIGSIDPWKILMSLRSGLMSECSWALNVLTGLLADDNAIQWFGLHHMPGLMETLLDHFRATLISLFEEKFKDLELNWIFQDGCDNTYVEADKKIIALLTSDLLGHSSSVKHSKDESKHQINILNNNNSVTYNPLNCKNVYMSVKGNHKSGASKFKRDSSEERWLKDEKKWDEHGRDDFESSPLDWQLGRGDSTKHIYLSMESSTTKKFSELQFFGNKRLSVSIKECKNEKILDCDSSNIVLTLPDSHDEDPQKYFVNEEKIEKITCNHEMCKDFCIFNSSSPNNDYVEVYESFNEEDNNSFNTNHECLVELERKCLQISNIFRSLSFVPSNDVEFSKQPGLLIIIARVLLLGHEHKKTVATENLVTSNTPDISRAKCLESESLNPIDKFLLKQTKISQAENVVVSYKTLETLREDALVILSNITGQLDLSIYPEEICAPILDGLLHWCTCNSFIAKDCNVSKAICPAYSTFADYNDINPSFFMLALESASKLCILDSNADLLVATPPYSRIVLLLSRLSDAIISGCASDNGIDTDDDPLTWMTNQIAREFSLVIISSLVQADPGCSTMLSLKNNFIPSLLSFIEVQCCKMMQPNLPSASSLQSTSPHNDYSPDMLKRAVLIIKHVVSVISNSQADVSDERRCKQVKRNLLKHKERIIDLLCNKMPSNTGMTSTLAEILDICSSYT